MASVVPFTQNSIDRMEGELEARTDHPDRGQWGKKLEFLLTCMGYAVGLGNVWRFPYLCYRNGGGAFLVPYLLMLVLCGIPIFFLEMAQGQFSSISTVTLFAKICPLLKGVGYAIIVVNFMCTIYYSVIIAYPIYFVAMSLASKLPWEDCDNEWNTDRCVKFKVRDEVGVAQNETATRIVEFVNVTGKLRTPADEFFHLYILQISGGIEEPGTVVWPVFFCNMATWVIIFFCIMNGVKSVGKVVYFTATYPFVILFVLFVRGVTLPGAIDGIWFYISPNWEQLKDLKVWVDAAVQIFFSLGPGWGGLINMASYNPFRNNCMRDSILVPIINCSTSIFAGFVVFSVLGFMSHQTGMPVSSVTAGGPSLAFVTYPEAISMLPLAQLWSVLFFSMLIMLGLGTQFVLVEVVTSSVMDEYPHLRNRKKLVCFCCCFVMFIGSLSCVTNGGMYVLQLLDWYSGSISVILICLVEVMIAGWIYGCGNTVRDLEFMIGDKIFIWWPLCWKFISPAVLLFIFVTTMTFITPVSLRGVEYPGWAVAVGWMTAALSMLFIPGYAVYCLATSTGNFKKRLAKSLTPRKDWGPSLDKNRKEWWAYCDQNAPRWLPSLTPAPREMEQLDEADRREDRSFL